MNSTNQHSLWVFDSGKRVGAIGYDAHEERFSFAYEPSWLAKPNAYPLSPHFPLTTVDIASSVARRFLENLLPEGRALDVVSTTHQISKNNIFALVRELGAETSGALSFFPEGTLPESRPNMRREIPIDELRKRIEERAQTPFAVWDGRMRMSIAGFQDKLPVYIKDKRYYLVDGALASTHILKPEPFDERLSGLVANEHFCMRLAARLGLPTAEVGIARVPHPVLVVRRFDREASDDEVKRIHVIDACQALDLPVAYKYERNFGAGRDVRHIRDGVGFEGLFSTLVSHTPHKALTRQALTRWALLQYLIGNANAHGKNLSFFCRPEGLVIAPFYDLVSTVQYDGLDQEFAMAYGDEFRMEDVTPFAWADFAKRAGLQRSYFAREMQRMAKAALEHAPLQALEPDYLEEEKAQLDRTVRFIEAQARKLLSVAKPMQEIDAAQL